MNPSDDRGWAEAVYIKCAARMERYAASYLYAFPELLPDAEEYVLEAFTRIFQHRKKLMRHKNIEAWLMKTLKSILLNAIRKLKNRGSCLGIRIDMDTFLQFEGLYRNQNAQDKPTLMEICDILRRVLTPQEYRLFELTYLENKSPQEIAQGLGLEINATYQRLRRLRQKIQAVIKNNF